jgi:predicted enzyme related to lactoylglutathione lyase
MMDVCDEWKGNPMTLLSFSALTMYSSDPERLADFYREAIGVPLAPDRHGKVGEHFECDIGNVHLAVLRAGTRSSPMVPVFQVDDLDRAHAHMDFLRVEARHEPMDLGDGMRVVNFTDPDGNAFGVIEIRRPG